MWSVQEKVKVVKEKQRKGKLQKFLIKKSIPVVVGPSQNVSAGAPPSCWYIIGEKWTSCFPSLRKKGFLHGLRKMTSANA